MTNIDTFDRHILQALSRDGAVIPNFTMVADLLHKPKTTIHSRIMRLQEKGVLTGFEPKICQEARNVAAFMLVRVASGTDVDKLAARLVKTAEITEIYYVAGGEWSMILKIEVPDIADYSKFSSKIDKNFPEIAGKQGMIVPKTLK